MFDADGFLIDRDDWSNAILREIADDMDIVLTGEVLGYVIAVREEYEKNSVVPPLREFSKLTGGDRKGTALNAAFNGGPMKKLARLAGLPKPTGCV
jgi:TusE/DsrC/DsvC family sulfur relay protein